MLLILFAVVKCLLFDLTVKLIKIVITHVQNVVLRFMHREGRPDVFHMRLWHAVPRSNSHATDLEAVYGLELGAL